MSSSLPGIDVKEAQKDGSRVQLTVTVPAAHVKKAWDKAMRKAASGLTIPGFRPGKKVGIVPTNRSLPQLDTSLPGIFR